jgi:hypothetical protein
VPVGEQGDQQRGAVVEPGGAACFRHRG